MNIDIPDEFGITEAEARLALAVGLYIAQRATLAKAARFAGLSRLEFQSALAERKIDLNLDESDLDEDIESLQRLNI